MRAAALFPLLLVACQTVTDRPPAPAAPAFRLVPAAGGLDVAGSGGREIGFGRDRAGVIETIARIEGVAPRVVVCGGGLDGAVTASGLRLAFRAGTFVGWDSGEARAGRSCA